MREVNRRIVLAYTEAVDTGLEVTLDVDAQLVETSKSEAMYCYEGYKAFQPIEVEWAETKLVLADEFREGNVPASKDIKRLVNVAHEALPVKPWQVKVRSDSAAYDQDNLDHWDQKGWRFAVSADISVPLRAAIETLPEESWRVWKEEREGKGSFESSPKSRTFRPENGSTRKTARIAMWRSRYGNNRWRCLQMGISRITMWW